MDEGWRPVAGKMRGGDTGHLVERRNEAVDHAVHLGAFAERQDVAVRGMHAVIDDDAAIDGKARLPGKPDAGTDSDSHDDERCGNDAAVVELYALDLAVSDDLPGIGLADHLDAALFHRLLQ